MPLHRPPCRCRIGKAAGVDRAPRDGPRRNQSETSWIRVAVVGFHFLTFAGEHYVEIWNPPEARAGATGGSSAGSTAGTRRDPSARKPSAAAGAKHKRVAPRVVEARMHHPPTAVKIAPKPRAIEDDAPRATPAPASPSSPGTPDIPRLFTPDGNVLRVGTRGYHADVSR